MVTGYVLPPILKPFLYGLVCLILEITQLSGAPKPASGPVSGWIQPMVMPLAVPAPDPLMLVPHAASSPPKPAKAAPAPAARSSPRRLMAKGSLGLSECAVWSLIRHRSPLASATGSGEALRKPRRSHWYRLLRSGALAQRDREIRSVRVAYAYAHGET